MTRADIQQSLRRLVGDPQRLEQFIRSRRQLIGDGVNRADWDVRQMDDYTLMALVGFGLLALWQYTESGPLFGAVPEPLPYYDNTPTASGSGGSVVPTPQPAIQPRPQPPGQGGDQIDLSQATIVGGSPDFRGWPIVTQLAIVGLEPAIVPSFSDPGWPDIVPDGWDGPLEYTVCVLAPIGPGGSYVGSGIVQMWRGREHCGDNQAANVREQLWKNWWYYIPELAGYLPAPGDQLAFCVCAGNLRNGSGPIAVAERSNVVLVSMP